MPIRRAILALAFGLAVLAAAPAASMGATVIKVIDDDGFGPVLHDGRGQAIYAFTHDRRNRSRCHGECAHDWPPVLTAGMPRAGRRVDPDLLGTTRRADRSRQVTYRGRPLYFYRNEGRRQIFCQNVLSFGGRWLVVRPSGRLVR
jgi:predicted lipoprotein with Yx(FWY)xxD motif